MVLNETSGACNAFITARRLNENQIIFSFELTRRACCIRNKNKKKENTFL